MAAPRKYSSAQRQEIYRLHEAGLTSNQIADACARGTAGVEPFTIPRGSVSAIVAKMAQETAAELPTELGDISSLETVFRHPERIARILDAEIARLERKPPGRLTPADVRRLREIITISGPLQKRLEGRTPHPSSSARSGRRTQRRQETAVERLEREEAGTESGISDPSHTRTCQGRPDLDRIPVPTQPSAATLRPPRPSGAADALAAARAVAAEHGLPTEAFDQAAERGGESLSSGGS